MSEGGTATVHPVLDPFADWGDRARLPDRDGRTVLVFTPSETTRDAVPWADGVWVPPTVPVAEAAALAVRAFAGWRFSTSMPALAAAVIASGAVERRHAHTMTHRLQPTLGIGPLPDVRVEPLSAEQVDRHALRLGELNLLAYPEGHPDAFDGDEAAAVSQIRAIARGELLGPLLAESRIAVARGSILGACLVVDRAGTPPYGGPWVIDLFRDPRSPARGVGTALLCMVLAAAREARLPGISLTVSDANTNARSLYRRLGFEEVDESWTLALPGEDERPGSVSSGSQSPR